jgi:peptidoglycan/xylan/chitin deacetylase (PgdA/CDA1 family)
MAQPETRLVATQTGMIDDSESPRLASRVLKFVISLAFYVITESWRLVLRGLGKMPPPAAMIIYYHHVLSEQRRNFARQLDHLARWTTPLRADNLEPLAAGVRYSIVTVDDGWKSFADNAVPELQRRNIPVTIFAISDRLGQSVDGIEFDRLVSLDELRALNSGVVTIGSHGATHARMTTLSEQDAYRELRESREKLSSITGHAVTMFCFPYGAYSDELSPICRKAGYQRIFTCLPVLADFSNFVQGRVRVDPTDLPIEFHLKLMGAYRWLPMAIALKRRVRSAIRGGSRVTEESREIRAA